MTASPSIRKVERSLASSLTGGYIEFIQEILQELEDLGWQSKPLFGVQMALEETISNGIRHGNQEDPSKCVQVRCQLSPSLFWAQIQDEGSGFQPEVVPDCRAIENLETPGGRGLALIRAFMTKVSHNDCGNCITLEKQLGPVDPEVPPTTTTNPTSK